MRFKKRFRHNIKIEGGLDAVDQYSASAYLNKLKEFIERGYEPEQVFNVNEAVFWNRMPIWKNIAKMRNRHQ